MAKDRFQRIEALAAKVLPLLSPGSGSEPSIMVDDPAARFAFDRMKLEILTKDKDLKYHLFGTFLRWLEYGERFKIPNTPGAYLVGENRHSGTSIGYVETIKVYLTFGTNDPLDVIIDWLYNKIEGRADAMIVHGKRIPIELHRMRSEMQERSLLELGSSDEVG